MPPGHDDDGQDLEDRRVDVRSPEVPPGIRAAVLPLWGKGFTLWRCPRTARGRWLGLGPRRIVIEWWLEDADGELIEAFWEA